MALFRLVVLLCASLALLHSRAALACEGVPDELARPHESLVSEASAIFLAEIIGSKPTKLVPGARRPVTYVLRVLVTYKGDPKSSVVIEGDGDLSGIWDTTFSDHTDPDFWERQDGRMGIQGSCEMVPAHFIVGKRYLVFQGVRPDTKQFERVDSDSDRWILYVRSQTRPTE